MDARDARASTVGVPMGSCRLGVSYYALCDQRDLRGLWVVADQASLQAQGLGDFAGYRGMVATTRAGAVGRRVRRDALRRGLQRNVVPHSPRLVVTCYPCSIGPGASAIWNRRNSNAFGSRYPLHVMRHLHPRRRGVAYVQFEFRTELQAQ